ncbi:arginase family protein [Beijerinckia indica]|nr:arginase family protein [Beijerinckia indica]
MQTGEGAFRLAQAAEPFIVALRGWVCDRYTSGGMQGASLLAHATSARLNAPVLELGEPESAQNLMWRESLDKATPYLRDVGGVIDEIMGHRRFPMIFANRCGASLATIAAALRHRPDAKVIWCDAHGDFNTPASTPTGYLGGMVLTALCGLWDSGLGTGLSADRIILVGQRDIDPGEQALIDHHGVTLLTAHKGHIDHQALLDAIGGAPVWFHIDTDVIDPLYLPAEYRVDAGLSPQAVQDMLATIVEAVELVGFEMTEFEAPPTRELREPIIEAIMTMLSPLWIANL